jgi:hypothetical protein
LSLDLFGLKHDGVRIAIVFKTGQYHIGFEDTLRKVLSVVDVYLLGQKLVPKMRKLRREVPLTKPFGACL